MRNLRFVAVFVLTVVFGKPAHSADPKPPAVGKVRVNWTDLPGTDDKKHSLADFADRDAVVIAITCNHCPIAIEYFTRLKQFATKHCGPKGKVALVAISLSDLETDELSRMKELAERQSFNFPYVRDDSQRIGKQIGATVTPQFFVLDRNRTLAYRGAWDDDVNESKVKTLFVEDAVTAILAGREPKVSETKARGCHIDYR